MRQHRLLRLLDESRDGLSAQALAEKLGCNRRTLYRDLHVLETVGWPLYQEPAGKQVRWRLVEGKRKRLSLDLSRAELLALQVARGLLVPLGDTFLARAAGTALAKLEEALPVELRGRAEAADGLLLTHREPPRVYADRDTALQVLCAAVRARESVSLRYRKLGSRTVEQRTIDPYHIHLHLHASAFYVIGWCHKRRDLRIFLLDRIQSAERTGKTFTPRSDVDPASVLQGDLGPWRGDPGLIRLRFASTAAPLVTERKLHPSQQARTLDDGRAELTLHAPVTPWLLHWLTGWGAEVEVLSPPELAAQVRARHEAALDARRAATRRPPSGDSEQRVTSAVTGVG